MTTFVAPSTSPSTPRVGVFSRLRKSQPWSVIDGSSGPSCKTLDAVFCGRRYSLLVSAFLNLARVFLRLPHYELPRDVGSGIQPMSWQIQHPLTPIPAELKDVALYGGPASHVDKMELRLTLPLLGRLSGTGKWTVMVWSPIAAVFLFYLLALCARDVVGNATAGALFVIGLGATFFGSWGFNDFGCGDAVAFALTLLSACCLNRPWLAGFCFLGAAFCDERSVTAAPLLLLYFIVRCSEPTETKQRNRLVFAILGTIGVWVILRWWLSATFHLSTGTSMLATWEIFRSHMTDRQTLFSLIGLFRASWTIPALAVYRLIRDKEKMLATALLVAFGIAATPAFLVTDMNRSICYSFMTFLISLQLLRNHRELLPNKYLAAILIVNILIAPPSRTILRFLT